MSGPSERVLKAWPNCRTADCGNKACASRNSVYCGLCTDSRVADGSAPIGYFDEFRLAQLLDEAEG